MATLRARMFLGITRDGRIVKCASHPAHDMFNAAEVSDHWRVYHKNECIVCAQCLAARIETTFDPGKANEPDIPFQSWYGNNVYKHLETHLAGASGVNNMHKRTITGDPWKHSPNFKTIDQELYEIASMRGQSLLTMALDLLEEDYKQTCPYGWDEYRQRISEYLIDRNRQNTEPI